MVDEDGLTPAEARALKKEVRGLPEDLPPPPPPEKPKSIDDYLQFLGDLRVAEAQYNEEMARKEAEKEAKKKGRSSGGSAPAPSFRPAPEPTPRPKPKPKPKPKPAPAPPPEPEPEPPPRPAPEPPPINRSPSGRGAGGGGLDDLFGAGAQEGRVRIGKRTKPKDPGETEESGG